MVLAAVSTLNKHLLSQDCVCVFHGLKPALHSHTSVLLILAQTPLSSQLLAESTHSVLAAIEHGYLQVYPIGQFEPNNEITSSVGI